MISIWLQTFSQLSHEKLTEFYRMMLIFGKVLLKNKKCDKSTPRKSVGDFFGRRNHFGFVVPLLFVAVTMVTAADASFDVVTPEMVQAGAHRVSQDLTALYADVAGYDRLVSTYASSTVDLLTIDGNEKVNNLRTAMDQFFRRKTNIVEALAKETTRHVFVFNLAM